MYSYEERLSNFDKARGIIGHECMNELLVKIRFAVFAKNNTFLLFFCCFGCHRGEKPAVMGFSPATGSATG